MVRVTFLVIYEYICGTYYICGKFEQLYLLQALHCYNVDGILRVSDNVSSHAPITRIVAIFFADTLDMTQGILSNSI